MLVTVQVAGACELGWGHPWSDDLVMTLGDNTDKECPCSDFAYLPGWLWVGSLVFIIKVCLD